MQIENSKLTEFITGYIRSMENDGYLSLNRFTKKQEDILVKRNFAPRNAATAGMKLEFITDADSFSFEYRISPGSSQRIFGIDLLVNGVNTKCDSATFEENAHIGTFNAQLNTKGEKRVTVWFPCLSKMEIKNFNIEGTMKKCVRSCKLLVLGDSITQGYVTEHPYLTYVNLLAQKMDADVLNQAIGGNIFFKEDLDEAISEAFVPDVITVAYGTNDWAAACNVYDNAKEYFTGLKSIYANVNIYALVPIHRNGIDNMLINGKTLEEIRCEIWHAAEETGVTPVDARNFVPHQEDYYWDKNLHPNQLGFVFYAENLFNAIKDI